MNDISIKPMACTNSTGEFKSLNDVLDEDLFNIINDSPDRKRVS